MCIRDRLLIMQIKRISDYYEALYELYPEVPKKDIERILNYGDRKSVV